MSGFADPIVGGSGNLIRQQIQSPNFNLGAKTGWAILKNGNAYFFNVVATGTIAATEFDGTDFIINSAGQFFYSGVPALGNLILAIANTSGTDSHGNNYPSGLTIWDGSGNEFGNWSTSGFFANNTQSTGSVQILPTNGTLRSPRVTFKSAISGFNAVDSNISSNINGVNPNQFDALVIQGPQSSSDTANSYIVIGLAGNATPGIGNAIGNIEYVNGGVVTPIATFGGSGFRINPGNLNSVKPGTANPATVESWHAASLATHFTTNAGDQAPRYRFEGIHSGLCRLDGVIYTDGTAIASGTTIFTLPAGYIPTQRKRFAVVNNIAASTVDGATFIVNTSGNVTTAVAIAAAVNQIVLENITFPVD